MKTWLFLAETEVTPLQIILLITGFSGFLLHAILPPAAPSIEAAVLAAASAA